jgi:hypothetical protein
MMKRRKESQAGYCVGVISSLRAINILTQEMQLNEMLVATKRDCMIAMSVFALHSTISSYCNVKKSTPFRVSLVLEGRERKA